MNFNDLSPDVHRLIVSHLDKDSVGSLSLLDDSTSYWKTIVSSSKINYDGPQNSTIFSLGSLVEHGPRSMPYVKHLDLVLKDHYQYSEFNQDLLFNALTKLKLNEKKKFSLTMIICEEIYSMRKVCKLLQTYSFQHVVFVGRSFYEPMDESQLDEDQHISNEETKKDVWALKSLKCPCEFFVRSTFMYLEELELSWDSVSERPEESQSILLAFQQNQLKKLVTLGPFLSPSIMKVLPTNYSLETLILVSYTYSYFDWSNAQYLQKYCPNIKNFSIQYSNLITRDLEFFDWSLWNLETLDLSNNYTLRDVKVWPKALTGLYLHDTNLDLSCSQGLDVSGLKHLSIDLSATSEWAHYLSTMKNIKTLYFNMRHFLSGVQFQASRQLIGGPWFWSHIKALECTVFVRLKEVFFRENILESHGSFLRAWIQ